MNQLSLLSKQEIMDYASRYVAPEDATDFAHDNDLFCIVVRKLSSDKVLAADEGWQFQGYGICVGYTVDGQEIPVGKWLWMHFVSLATFPPSMQTLKLQPPHAVKGTYQNPQRTEEFRILKININDNAVPPRAPDAAPPDPVAPAVRPAGKVLAFRKKPAKKRTAIRRDKPLPGPSR
jgi:hypothetical protein